MSIAQGGDLFEALGSAPPAVAARSADLLIVAGSLTWRQVPLLESLYERMQAPRWVLAWGECAISGGSYQNYATVSGLSRILPVDIIVRGCPPRPEAFRVALEGLRAGAVRAPVSPSSDESGWPIRKPYTVEAQPEYSRSTG
jgi:NADH-quinone oxidoreductase subunit B